MASMLVKTQVSRAHCSARSSLRRGAVINRRSVSVRAAGLEDVINSITVAVKNSPMNQGKKALAKMQAGSYDEVKIRSTINDYLQKNPVVVFSWTTCPFCKNAKAVLNDVGAKYTAVELNEMPEGNAIRAELAEMTDRTSMPNIFISGKSIGGCNDGPGVVTLQREGKLIPLLKAAGAL